MDRTRRLAERRGSTAPLSPHPGTTSASATSHARRAGDGALAYPPPDSPTSKPDFSEPCAHLLREVTA